MLNILRFINKVVLAKPQGVRPSVIYLFAIILTTACELQVEKVGDNYVIGGLPENCEGMSHGETLTFQMYSGQTPASGQSCESLIVDIVKSCNDGEVATSPEIPTFLTCSGGGTDPLPLSCGSVPHGGNIIQEGFSINEIPHDANYICNDRRISYRSGVCNNGVEVASGDSIPSPFHSSCVKLSGPGDLDALTALKAAKSMSELNNIATTASFQSQSVTALNKLGVKVFYARNADNASPNTVIAVSDRALVAGQPDSFNQAAVTVRCNAGEFQMRNAAAFEAVGMACELDKAYMIDLDIDGDLKKFNLRIEATGGQSVSKSNVAFRSTYTGAAALSHVNVISDRATADGSTRFDRVTQAHVTDNSGPVDPLACNGVPNGTVENRERFQAALVPEGSQCVSQPQSRTCVSGNFTAWSGTYAEENCRVDRPIGGGMLPTYVRSFGPNGTHWPELYPTPFMYDRKGRVGSEITHQIEVDANWTKIAEALRGVTKAMADAGTIILVRPANDIAIPSGAPYDGAWKVVLDNLGSSSWSKRVTIAPRDGYGSVKISTKFEWRSTHKVAMAGFIVNHFKCKDCHQSAIAWTRVNGYFSIPGEDNKSASELEVVEVVMPNLEVVGDDSANAYSAGGHISNYHVVGSYFAPHYKAEGSNSHTDTFQFATGCQNCDPTTYKNMKFKDTVIYTSTNCALQTGSLDGLELDHMFLVGDRALALSRYPLPSNAADPIDKRTGQKIGFIKVFNGSVKNGTIKDSILFGGGSSSNSMSSTPWMSVTNTKTNLANKDYGGVFSGSFTYESDLKNQVTFPTDPRTPGFLESLWLDPFN